MSLLRQIQEAAIDSNVDLASLLRKCKVLAARLGNDPFSNWVDRELSGFQKIEDLPAYRILDVFSKGHFSGGFGAMLSNADIPLSCIPEKYREHLSRSYLMEPIAALEALAKGGEKGTLQEQWNPDIVAFVGQKIYKNMNCLSAWKVIPVISVVGALDAVRTRVLNFVLEIEASNPRAGEAELHSNPVAPEKVQQIFNTYITGNVQNVATGGAGNTQTATHTEDSSANVLLRLVEALSRMPNGGEEATLLISSVEEMREKLGTSTFKAAYSRFMGLFADHIQVFGPVVAPFLPALSGMVA